MIEVRIRTGSRRMGRDSGVGADGTWLAARSYWMFDTGPIHRGRDVSSPRKLVWKERRSTLLSPGEDEPLAGTPGADAPRADRRAKSSIPTRPPGRVPMAPAQRNVPGTGLVLGSRR